MDEINERVAERLRRLRKAAGLSLEELATRSGVSRAMLSQIETLKANPTIAVLWKVSQGLGVPFSELLGPDEPPPAVRVSRALDARYLYSADGALRSRPLLGNVPGHNVEIYELRLAVGGVHAADAHLPGSLEQVVVVAGQLRVVVGADTVELAPGDAMLFPADRPHRYEAVGDTPFQGLSIILYEG